MDTFFENAHKLFDVASTSTRSDAVTSEFQDFAVLVREDGGLHFLMESPFTMESAAAAQGARTAYRVSRSATGAVRVEGREGERHCLMETKTQTAAARTPDFLRDAPCYRVISSLLISAAAEPGSSSVAPSMRWA